MKRSPHALHDEYDPTQGIGGSSVAAALGMSHFLTKRQLYDRIIGEAPAIENRFMYWGRMLEQAIFDGFAERTGLKLRRSWRTYRHPRYPFLLAHVDGLGYGFVFEAKTASVYADGWGDTVSLDDVTPETWADGGWKALVSDDIPDDYGLQLQHYMALTKRPHAFLTVLIGGNEARVYHAAYDEELYKEMILPGLVSFWRDHVEKRVPPELVAADEEDVRRRHPRAEDDLIISPTDLTEAAGEKLIATKRLKADLEKREKHYRAILEEAIGSHEGMIGERFKITWKNDPDRTETAWESVAHTFRAALEAAIRKAGGTLTLPTAKGERLPIDADWLDVIEGLATSTKKGSRRFLITELKKESGDEESADGAAQA